MRQFLPVLLALFASAALPAQDTYHGALLTQLQTGYSLPAGSQWALPNTETATFAGAVTYGATVTNFTPTGQAFSQARRFSVQQGNNP